MAIASGALVATSPGSGSGIDAVALSGSGVFDSDNPVIVQRIGIRVNAEAMAADPTGGGVSLDLDDPDAPALFGDGRDEPWIRITVMPDDEALAVDSVRSPEDGGEFFSIQSCARGVPCDADYTLVMEWLEPSEGVSKLIAWEIDGSVTYLDDTPEGGQIEIVALGDVEYRTELPSDAAPERTDP